MVVEKRDVNEIVKLLLINNQKAQQGFVIGKLYYKIGEFKAALKYVSRYLKIKPNSFFALKLQGECYEKVRRPDDAFKSYQKAIKLADKKMRMRHLNRNDITSSEEEIDSIDFNGTSERMNSSLSPIARFGIVNSPKMDNEMEGWGSWNLNFDETVVQELIGNSLSIQTKKTQSTPSDVSDDQACSEATVKFTVNHITTLDCWTCSEPFLFQNLSWRIVVTPKRDHGPSRTMSIYLHCEGATPLWSCNVDAEYRLLSVKPNHYPCVQKIRHLFREEDDSWGFPTFISWNEVVCPDGNYIRDDSVTVEVHLKALD